MESNFDLSLERATRQLSNELLTEVKPAIHRLIFEHAWAERPQPLEWLEGIWVNGQRGMVLTATGHPVLWASTSASKWTEAPVGQEIRAGFVLHCIKFAKTLKRL